MGYIKPIIIQIQILNIACYGILRLFRYLMIRHPEIAKLMRFHQSHTSVDWLMFDLNSEFHPVARKVFYPEPEAKDFRGGRKSFIKKTVVKKTEVVNTATEKDLFYAICKQIEIILKRNPVKKGIYFAIDGVAGVSKMSQQRGRRFMRIMEEDVKDKDPQDLPFDTSTISCGTLFMDRLARFLDNFIQRKMVQDSRWKNLTVVFSSDKIFGEGEHKIKHFMATNPNNSYTVVSPDGDLFMLLLGLHLSNLYVYRENIFSDIEADYFIVKIDTLRDVILDEIDFYPNSTEKTVKKEETKNASTEKKEENIINKCQKVLNLQGIELKPYRVIEDFIATALFLGNDFLPHLPAIDISNDGISIILRIYSDIISSCGFLTYKKINGHFSINKKSFKMLITMLADEEHQIMLNKIRNNKAKYADVLLQKHITYCPDNRSLGKSPVILNFKNYRAEYYDQKLHGVDIKKICHQYFLGMLFVLNYYLLKIPSYTWYYPFHYAPFFAEMLQHIDSFDFEQEFAPSRPFSQFEQLLAILPAKSNYLLPEPLRCLNTSADSPIIDLYPLEFDIDYDGKQQDYEAVICLVPADPERIRAAFKKVEDNLSEYDRKRNQPGRILTYKYNNENELIIEYSKSSK